MDLTQIRYFLALSEVLNFTRAAEACHVTQPALTKSIQKLEDELGGPLLLRERRDTQLTELGRAMVPLLRKISNAAEEARLGAAGFHRQDVQRIRIGLGPWIAPDTLLPVLGALHAAFPTLEVSVEGGSTASLSERLLASQIDVAFTVDALRLTPKANTWPLFEDPVAIILPAGHAMAAVQPMSAAGLSGQILIGWPGIEEAQHAIADVPLQPKHHAQTEDQVCLTLRSGRCLALSTVRRVAPADIVRRILLPGRSVTVNLALIPGRRHPRAVDAFVRLARARQWELPPADGVSEDHG